MKRFARVILALTLVASALAGAASCEIFPIQKKLDDVAVYMPRKIYMAWSDGTEVPSLLTLEGGDRQEIYIDVADTNGNGLIDIGDFDEGTIAGTAEITETTIPELYDIVEAQKESLLEALKLKYPELSQDLDDSYFDNKTYTWLCDQVSTTLSTEMDALIDAYAQGITDKVRVYYTLDATDDPDMLDLSSMTVASAKDIKDEVKYMPERFTIATATLTVKQQVGDEESDYNPDAAALKFTLGLSSADVPGSYSSAFLDQTRDTPLTDIEIHTNDTGGGSCSAGLGLVTLLATIPALALASKHKRK